MSYEMIMDALNNGIKVMADTKQRMLNYLFYRECILRERLRSAKGTQKYRIIYKEWCDIIDLRKKVLQEIETL